MSRSSSYTYDPKTGKWTKTTSNSSSSSSSSSNSSSGGSGSSSTTSSGSNLVSSNSDGNSSAGSVEKQYNDIEINTLTGTLSFIVTAETIKLKAGDTVKLQGLGSYLSGDYYVKDVTRQIGSDGYTHSATLIKTDFGNTLKVATNTTQKKTTDNSTTPTTNSSSAKNQKTVQSSPTASSAKRTYTVKKGDCLWNIAKKYYGNGALCTKIYDANKGKISNPKLIYVGQVLVIP